MIRVPSLRCSFRLLGMLQSVQTVSRAVAKLWEGQNNDVTAGTGWFLLNVYMSHTAPMPVCVGVCVCAFCFSRLEVLKWGRVSSKSGTSQHFHRTFRKSFTALLHFAIILNNAAKSNLYVFVVAQVPELAPNHTVQAKCKHIKWTESHADRSSGRIMWCFWLTSRGTGSQRLATKAKKTQTKPF